MYLFYILGVVGVFGGLLFSVMYGLLVIFLFFVESVGDISLNVGYKFG